MPFLTGRRLGQTCRGDHGLRAAERPGTREREVAGSLVRCRGAWETKHSPPQRLAGAGRSNRPLKSASSSQRLESSRGRAAQDASCSVEIRGSSQVLTTARPPGEHTAGGKLGGHEKDAQNKQAGREAPAHQQGSCTGPFTLHPPWDRTLLGRGPRAIARGSTLTGDPGR